MSSIIHQGFFQHLRAKIRSTFNFKTKLELWRNQTVTKAMQYCVIKQRTVNRTESDTSKLRAIRLVTLFPFGNWQIVLYKSLLGTVPWTTIAENNNVKCIKQSLPAFITWSLVKAILLSFLWALRCETACLTSWKLKIQSAIDETFASNSSTSVVTHCISLLSYGTQE